jgi:hypothetical protein
MNSSATADIAVTPPDSLTCYDAPLFVGVERSAARDHASSSGAAGAAATGPAGAKITAVGTDASNKLDDMINSMLPPRYSKHSIVHPRMNQRLILHSLHRAPQRMG